MNLMIKSFTMIELIFVIVVLGILSIIAVPKLMATRNDAKVTEIKANINTAIREIKNYVISQGEVNSDARVMSNAVSSMVNNNEGNISDYNFNVITKNGICIIFRWNTSELNVTYGNADDELCLALKQQIPQHIGIQLKGHSVIR